MASILIAEDNATIFKLISFRLEKMGHETIWAQDREQALVAMRQYQPDLVLLDVLMPVYDGFQVLKQARADPALKDIPIIILTALAHEKDIVTSLSNGADDYVVKPFSFAEVLARVNAALSRRGARVPAA